MTSKSKGFNFGEALAKLTGRKNKIPDSDIRFLHIGKTAGSQIASVISQINELSGGRKIFKHGHDKFLKHIPESSDYFFSIRHPVTRFYSGFYSRKRKGQPRNYQEHTVYDEFAFGEFEHANDLAESLFETDARGNAAAAAIKSIRHTAQNQFDWFYCCGAFLYRREPIHIIRQEHFDADLKTFFDRAGFIDFWDQIVIETDKVKSHANDYSSTPPLSDKAKENLERWYAQDLAFYAMCEDWITSRD